jgi:hypothetical protein
MIAARRPRWRPEVSDSPHDSRALTRARGAARLAEIRSSQRYVGVLGLIVVLFVFAALAPTTSWALSLIVLLEGITLALALWTGGRPNIFRAESVVLVVSIIVAAIELASAGDEDAYAGVSLYSAALVVAIILVIGHGVRRQDAINAQSVTGAIGIYVLLGMFFVLVFGATYYLGSKPFFAQTASGSRPLFLYFSFVTLATLGYGDYTAATEFGRMVAVIEALVGQVYLVTVVALLVSRIGRVRS